MTIFIAKRIMEEELRRVYSRILNFYTFSRELKPFGRTSQRDELSDFKNLSVFIKKVNNLDVVFVYDVRVLKRSIENFEGFLRGKVIFGNYILEGDIPKDYKLIEKIVKTETFGIYNNLLNPIFVYTYPINLNSAVIGKVAFIERFSHNVGLMLVIFFFPVVFTLLSVYLPVRFLSHVVNELNYLSKLSHEFSRKDFSKIDELRRSIREMKEKNEIYQLKVSLLKMVETFEQYIRRLKKDVESYENLAFTDQLTGLYNRRMFLEIAEKKLNEAKRYQEPLSIIMLDIDLFKRINDTYGHDIGDLALKFLANILRKNVRASDIVARWGGEEFVILLPKTSLEQAYRVAEKIRKIVEFSTVELPDGVKLKFTVSLGVSSFRGQEDLEELLKEADVALYEAKRRGRNRTEVYKRSLSF